MGRSQQEHLAQQVAMRSTMPSTTNQVAYLRAQLALRDAQIEQVKAQRDSHFVQEEEVLEADLTALCKSNSVQVQSNTEHQKLHDAQERRLQLEAQALREAHQHEQQAAHTAQEYQDMVHELRRQADEQPDMQKLLWKKQLSQQADYRAEIHELHTELLNMREKSEMKSHLAANMCRLEQTVPSRTVDAEPENVLNTLSPGRSNRWILPHELVTPDRPTSSGLQSPIGAPVQLGPSPLTREYSATPPGHIPPAQWGNFCGRAGDDGCELFGALPGDGEPEEPICPQQAVHQPDELNDARSPLAPLQPEPLVAARCVNGTLLRPGNAEEEPPSTARRQSEVRAPGGVPLGRGAPGQQQSPGGLRGRNLNPPVPPPPPPPHIHYSGPPA